MLLLEVGQEMIAKLQQFDVNIDNLKKKQANHLMKESFNKVGSS
jgi:hypothetical protein